MTVIKYALLCTIFVQAIIIQSASISKLTDLDAVKTLSLPFTSNYNYQPPQAYNTLFQTQPSLAPLAQAFNGYPSGVSTPPVQQQSNYGGSISQPIQQSVVQAPVAQQQGGYGGYQSSAPVSLPVQPPVAQQQGGYGGYQSSAPVQQQQYTSAPVSAQPIQQQQYGGFNQGVQDQSQFQPQMQSGVAPANQGNQFDSSQFGSQQGFGMQQQGLGNQQQFSQPMQQGIGMQQQGLGNQQQFSQPMQQGQTFTLSNTISRIGNPSVMSADELPNHCVNGGIPQAIFEGDVITETYCRCQSGSYGRTCAENMANPCGDEIQYHPADPSFGGHYFIECSWGIPYLMKCPATTLWSQELLTCATPNTQADSGYGQSGYGGGSYGQGYGQPSGYGSSSSVPVAQTQQQYGGNSVPVPVAQTQQQYGGNSVPVPVAQTQQQYGGNSAPMPISQAQSYYDSQPTPVSITQTQPASVQQPYDQQVPVAQSQYGGNNSPVPVSVQSPIKQSQGYGDDNSVISQSQSSYGGYGNSPAITAISSPVKTPIPPIKQSFEQPLPVAQASSSYGGYGSSSVQVPSLTQSSYDSQSVQLPVSQNNYGGSAPVKQSIKQSTSSYDQSMSVVQPPSSTYGGQMNVPVSVQSQSFGSAPMVPVQSQFNQVIRQSSSSSSSSFGQQSPVNNLVRQQQSYGGY